MHRKMDRDYERLNSVIKTYRALKSLTNNDENYRKEM